MITIIDYGMGNLGSIKNMIEKLGGEAEITSDVEIIKNATKLILPGVGSFDSGMTNLKSLGLIDVLNKKVLVEKTPILGICLGMQLISKSSEEGILPGLCWIDAQTIKFKLDDKSLKIPHMGWNYIKIEKDTKLFSDALENSRFYFVHSYHVVCNDKNDILTTTEYGINFVSAVNRENIYATQFHPEKSHKFGMKIMKNFIELI
ncbi:imidazole glycerol phosphate synthase subunit HisH [Candidatus Woesearchaeota archaeon]|nr:imidazole glycerol phosphate synthase subunit HisH [Candidatus Woesearchaeota archaeon]